MTRTVWTHDDLATPESSEVVEEVYTSTCCYRLMHDANPNRWYVAKIVMNGLGLKPDGDRVRTPVYGSRNAPALKELWGDIQKMKAAHDRAVGVNGIGLEPDQ